MTYKGDIEYDRFRQMVFSMTDKGLLDMIEEITLEIRRRAERKPFYTLDQFQKDKEDLARARHIFDSFGL